MIRFAPVLLLLLGCPAQVLEVCGDGIDNDGDGLIDPGCDQLRDVEICTNFIDDDADGVVDCADADCVTEPNCVVEDCFDGFDNDLDGLLDCDDSDCREEAHCKGGARWYVSGDAVLNADRTTYTGNKVLHVEVADNDGDRYNIGDVLCTTEWGHGGNGAAGNCVGCEWALYLNTAAASSQTGPECSYWTNFTNPESGYYYGVGSFPGGLGYHSAYSNGTGTTFPAVMFTYGGLYGGGWYALPARTELDWNSPTGEFSWSLLWAYDYYR